MLLSLALEIGKLGGFISLAVFLVKFLMRIRLEEDLMIRHFPAEYQEYKKNTKALVPFLW